MSPVGPNSAPDPCSKNKMWQKKKGVLKCAIEPRQVAYKLHGDIQPTGRQWWLVLILLGSPILFSSLFWNTSKILSALRSARSWEFTVNCNKANGCLPYGSLSYTALDHQVYKTGEIMLVKLFLESDVPWPGRILELTVPLTSVSARGIIFAWRH